MTPLRLDISNPRGGPGTVTGVVLMLHGGTERSSTPVDGRNLQWLRTRLMAAQIKRRLQRDGLAVWVPRYRVAGWNAAPGGHPAPVRDAREALDQITATHPGLPIVIIGHSMGARTATRVADHEGVRGVVALAGWLPRTDPVAALRGVHVAAAHGDTDEITSAAEARAYLANAASVAASTRYQSMGAVGHYLLKGVRRWNAYAAATARQLARADAQNSSRL